MHDSRPIRSASVNRLGGHALGAASLACNLLRHSGACQVVANIRRLLKWFNIFSLYCHSRATASGLSAAASSDLARAAVG